MKVRDITDAIEEFAPLGIQEKWDNSGLVIGSPESPVSGVLVGFDCTAELVDEAIELGADMIVTHHPLIFGGVRKIDPGDPVGLAIIKAASAGISVYAAHTTADKVLSGVSGAMAARLGLLDVEILDRDAEDSGLGAVGNLPSPMTAAEAVRFIKERFSLGTVRCSRPVDTMITRIAMCGGSGSSLIPQAVASGAQLYVSGDISYHHFFTPQGFMVMDIGHFESEADIVDILFSLIRKKFPTFAVHMSGRLRDANPVHYL